MSIRVPRQKVEALFKILKLRKGKWKGKTEASRRLGLSRPTIDKILALYPEGMPKKPKKMIPKYYEQFELTELAEKIKAYYWDVARETMRERGDLVWRVAREAFKVLGNRPPLTEDDYLMFWGTPTQPPHPDFVDPQTGKLDYARASSLRMCMKLTGATTEEGASLADDPRFSSKGLKREAGLRKERYLSTELIIKVIGVIREVDTLILFFLGILFGGRFSAFAGIRRKVKGIRRILGGLKVEDIDLEAEVIQLSEPKIKKERIEKDVPTPLVLELLKFYINDFNIKGRLFKWNIHTYNDRLKKAGEEASVPFPLTTHILKHTAITQMSLHGVDIDVIEDYVETEARTIRAFYRGGGRKKIRQQIKGIVAEEVEPWNKYVEGLISYVLERYNYLKPLCEAVDGIKLKE